SLPSSISWTWRPHMSTLFPYTTLFRSYLGDFLNAGFGELSDKLSALAGEEEAPDTAGDWKPSFVEALCLALTPDERGGREPEVCRIGLVDSQRGAWRVGRCRQKVVDQAIGKAASPDREGRGWLAPANGVPGISGSTVEPGRVDPRPLTWHSMSEDRSVRPRQSNPPADLDDVWVTFGEWNRLCAVPWQEPKQGDSTVS